VEVNWSLLLVADVPAKVVTVRATVAATCGGATAVMLVSLVTVKLAAGTPPKVTAVAPVKPLPVSVTGVPPLLLPLAGLTAVTVGVLARV
jgi:hypothetical protein